METLSGIIVLPAVLYFFRWWRRYFILWWQYCASSGVERISWYMRSLEMATPCLRRNPDICSGDHRFSLSSLSALPRTPGFRAELETTRSRLSIAISCATRGLYLPVLVRLRRSSRLIVEALLGFSGRGCPLSMAASASIRVISSAIA